MFNLVTALRKEYDRTPSIWPIYGYILSGFGYRKHPLLGRMEFHSGLDIPGWVGAPIRVAASGEVKAAFWAGGYGMTIIVNHKNGYQTIYSHLSKYLVKAGDYVTKGQLIALVGSTGLSTGPHLHYEIRYRNKPVNPNYFLNIDIFQMRLAKRKAMKTRRR